MSSTPKTLNVTEQHQLLDALLNKDAPHKSFRKGVRNYLIGCLMLEAGLRVKEVTLLIYSDLYFCGQYVKTLVVRPEIAKNHEERTIYVSTRLANAIEEFGKENDYIFTEPATKYIFSGSHGRIPITTRQAERIINAAGYKAFGRPVHPHMLRHTFASKLMRVTDMKTVQELLGHKNMTSTQIYCHPNEDDKKKAIEKINFETPCNHPLHRGLPFCPDKKMNENEADN